MFMKTLIALTSVVAMLVCQKSFCASARSADDDGRTIFKCKSETGAYTYQEKPCPERSTTLSSWKSDVARTLPSPPNIQQKPPPSFSIKLSPNGSYMTQGSANSVPVIFLIDTGADYVSIPQEIAYRAGMVCGKQTRTETANGSTTQCESIIRKMTFGNFRIQNVKAMILPNLNQPLLGMNVLSLFHVEHAEGVMTITYKH